MWGILPLGGAVIIVVWWVVLLVLHDETRCRLPDRLTLPAALGAALGALLTEPALLLGGLGWSGVYLIGGVVSRGTGGGDIKLALSLGVLAAAAGGGGGVLAAAVTASAVTVVRGVAQRGTVVPHGPSMLVGTGLVVFLGACQGVLTSPGSPT
ncbi:prepilin peptidase [Corynebacterium comes]|uniref:Prepilin type IV endopeptidase peptidase domain-containing protein n=1 Tax=Corynebacterium comes TaxID=2675218 RepID=A0A6B8VNJ9_9CORY|nr:prepilin peptidase [Corynebacterium comes]QGU04709.1 hypothetical protein CETAM_07240 [Corynebacterium comes]